MFWGLSEIHFPHLPLSKYLSFAFGVKNINQCVHLNLSDSWKFHVSRANVLFVSLPEWKEFALPHLTPLTPIPDGKTPLFTGQLPSCKYPVRFQSVWKSLYNSLTQGSIPQTNKLTDKESY